MATGALRSPPELLRELLAEDRTAGFAFDDVFTENVRIAGGASGGWHDALVETRDAWQAAWDNAPGPIAALSPDMTYDAREHIAAPRPTAVGARPS